MRRAVSIHRMLLLLNLMVLIVPLSGFVMLRLYQTILIQQTESRLISEAVLIGELWRDAYLAQMDLNPNAMPGIMPPGARRDRFYPVEPRLTGHDPVLPAQDSLPGDPNDLIGPAAEAGRRIRPVLERAQRFNLTAARVVDRGGVVVASTGHNNGRSLIEWVEVREALNGRYAAVARDRDKGGPTPPVWSIQRRGSIRVFVALPIFSNGSVIGAVSMSRTIMGPLQGLWQHRYLLGGAALAGLLLVLSLTFFFSRAISQPMARLTDTARAIAEGRPHLEFRADRGAPDEIRLLGDALNTMTRELDARTRYILDFSANVSHELKTPITSIRGAVELLQEGDVPPTQRNRFLANIDAAVQRMQRQVAQLLFLAGVEHGEQPVAALPVAQALQAVVDAAPGEVELVVVKDPGETLINPAQFESAVGNLIDNAVRHGMGKPVEVVLAADETHFSVAVRDHGPGVSPANQKQIFKRFFTTERDRGGTGLGLAVVQAVARANGGQVTLTSSDQGACFRLSLKRRPAETVAAQQRRAAL